MTLKKLILPMLVVFCMASIASAQIECNYSPTESGEIGALMYKYGANMAFVKWCCDTQKGCTDNYRSYSTGEKLTHAAAKGGHNEALEYFINEKGISYDDFRRNMDTGNYIQDYTQLMYAVKAKDYASSKLLLSKGASTKKQNMNNQDAMYFAKQTGNQKLIDLVAGYYQKMAANTMRKVKESMQDIRNFGTKAAEYNYAVNDAVMPFDMFKFDFSIIKDWNTMTLTSSNTAKARA